MKIKLLTLLILVSVSLPAFSVVPRLTVMPNSPKVYNFSDAKKLTGHADELNELKKSLKDSIVASSAEMPENLRAKKKGGGLANLPFIGSYTLVLGDSTYNFDITDGVINKSGNGVFEYVIYDVEDGSLYDNSIGFVRNFVSSFAWVGMKGTALNTLVISRKIGYGGSGVSLFKVFATDCVDQSEDFIYEVGESYTCTFIGPNYASIKASLVRKRTN